MGYNREYCGGGGGGSDRNVCQKSMFEISPEKYVSKEVKADGGHSWHTIMPFIAL